MEDTGFDYVHAIAAHSAGLADAASGNLPAAVSCCPGWTVADLVAHLTEVQWFWGTIVEERLSSPPPDEHRPGRAAPGDLIKTFREGAERLVRVLRAARDTEPVWTWAPAQADVGFVRRHQVQEAAVHHWDAANAAGLDVEIETAVAVDSISEFLTFSVSSADDPAAPVRPSLGGTFALCCDNADVAWVISDGPAEGTVAFGRTLASGVDVPAITGPASDLLLWLYQRVHLHAGAVPIDLTHRFRHLCFTE